MASRLLDVDDPAWATFLESGPHDFYHLPEYVRLSARHEGGRPAAIHVTDGDRELLQPVIIRPIPGGGHDATSPYGYPGPLVRGADDDAFLSAAFREGIALLRGLGIVSLFVRLHPLLNARLPDEVGTLVRGGDTVSIDLTLPPDEQWRQVRGNHRVHIHRAARNGRVARFDDDWAHAEDFKRLYRGTMARVAATPYYFFGDDYFKGLRAALGDRMRLSIVEADGEVAAAALFVETSGIVQYHLSGTAPAYVREGLTKVLIDDVRRWATDRGDRVLHLGGGLSSRPDDPLFHFKAGFSERRHPFYTLRVVVDRDAYEDLVRARASETGATDGAETDPDGRAAYFPAYRSPADRRRPTEESRPTDEISAADAGPVPR